MMKHAAPGSARSLVSHHEAGRRRGDSIWLRELPYLIVLACTAGGLAVIRLGAQYVKSGTLVLAGVLLIAATARLVLSDRRAGMLSSRRRLVDVAIFATLGFGLLVAGLVVHPT